MLHPDLFLFWQNPEAISREPGKIACERVMIRHICQTLMNRGYEPLIVYGLKTFTLLVITVIDSIYSKWFTCIGVYKFT